MHQSGNDQREEETMAAALVDSYTGV